MPAVKLLIGGVDKTAYLEPSSFVRTAMTGQPIDRLSLTLVDHDGGLGTITAMQEIVAEKSDDATLRYFGGLIARIDEAIIGLRREVRLDCQDWTVLVDKVYAPVKIYTPSSYPYDRDIIQDLFLEGFKDPMTPATTVYDINTSTYVQQGRPSQYLTVSRQPLSQLINMLATHSIYEWYIDYSKNLHFYEVDAELSSIHLSDNPDGATTFAYANLRKTIDGIQLANAIMVVGGFNISTADSEIIEGDGAATEYATQYIWFALEGESLPQVWRNDGTLGVPVWTQLTVFRADDPHYAGGANQVTWDSLNKVLVFGSAPPNLANAIRVNGRFQVRIMQSVPYPESKTLVGRWFWYKIIDSNIRTINEAYLRAAREALVRRFGITTYTLRTQADGFVVGKKVQLTNTIFGLSAAEFTIERSIMRLLGGTTAEYELTLRTPYAA